jgi:hypothetical protein
MANVQWKQFKEYSGPMIQGTEPIPPPTSKFHVERAYWLTTKVETGATFGTVIAYDGTGMTAGPDQHIAVFPKELIAEDHHSLDDQGSLWKLLRRMEMGGEATSDYYHALGQLWAFFKSSMNAYVAQDGVLRYAEAGMYYFTQEATAVEYRAGDPVFGHHIRAALTPTPGSDRGLGQVPKSGKEWDTAAQAALLFHELMVHPNGRQIQVEFGKEHLVRRTKLGEAKVSSGLWVSIRAAGYGDREVTSLRVGVGGWTEELDLALCMYQAHSVNAPAVANQALAQVSAALPLGPDFARELIRELGTSSYGRWDDDLPTGRYQRTRSAALGSGLWSRDLFEGARAIMPKDLPG